MPSACTRKPYMSIDYKKEHMAAAAARAHKPGAPAPGAPCTSRWRAARPRSARPRGGARPPAAAHSPPAGPPVRAAARAASRAPRPRACAPGHRCTCSPVHFQLDKTTHPSLCLRGRLAAAATLLILLHALCTTALRFPLSCQQLCRGSSTMSGCWPDTGTLQGHSMCMASWCSLAPRGSLHAAGHRRTARARPCCPCPPAWPCAAPPSAPARAPAA